MASPNVGANAMASALRPYGVTAGAARRGVVWVGLASLAVDLPALAADAPDGPWRSATPESQGFSAARLDALRADLVARSTKALLIIRNDAIVCE